MKMKIFFFSLFLLLVSVPVFSQANKGIQFVDSAWNNLLLKAKTEHKLIFMDTHTTWCGPCKLMDKNVFSDAQVADLYNRNFVNAYTDMEKGEGIDLKKKYNVAAYPTYLFINGDGEVIHKGVGMCSIAEFIQYGLDAMSATRNLSFYKNNYEQHQKDYNYVAGYLKALKNAYEESNADQIVAAFLSQLQPASLQEKGNWELINNYLTKATSSEFRYVVKHQNEFEELYGKDEVDQKIYNTYLMWPRHYLHYSIAVKVSLDQKGLDEFLSQVEKSSYNKKAEIIGRTKLTIFSGQQDWKNYVNTVSQMVNKKIIPLNPKGAEDIYFSIDQVYRFEKEDKNVLAKATVLAKLISEKIEGVNVQNKATYLDMYANLLDETGNKDQAILVRKSIDRKKLAEAQKNAPFQQLIITKKNK